MFKSPKFILFLILAAFFFRGVFLVAVFPIFKGQDESRHYNTVQYLSTGKDTDCQNYLGKDEDGKDEFIKNEQDKQDLSTYRYSDEIKVAASIVQTKQVRGEYYDKIIFTENSIHGVEEEEFKKEVHLKTQHNCPPDVAYSAFGKDGFSLYQHAISRIETLLSARNIFVRYEVARIISVLLGVILLWAAYYIFKTVKFSEKQSLILIATVSFQPKLVTYFTNINYDVLLMPLWTGVVLVSVVILKKGWSLWRVAMLVLLLVGAMMTKPSALPLLGLVGYLAGVTLYKKIRQGQISKNISIIVGVVSLVVATLLFNKVGLLSIFSGEGLSVLGKYLGESLPKIYGSSRDYWGVMGWSMNNLTLGYVKVIWVIEWIAWAGLMFWTVNMLSESVFKNILSKAQWKFFRKLSLGRRKEEKSDKWRGKLATNIFKSNSKIKSHFERLDRYLRQLKSQEKYFWFMLVAVALLQVGIRVADWKFFISYGRIETGTPGRYWLPSVIPHFVLLGLGLRVITGFFRDKKIRNKYFELSLFALLILMILYWTYEVFNIIIPRFYL